MADNHAYASNQEFQKTESMPTLTNDPLGALITWQNINVQTKNKKNSKNILKNITGLAKPGDIIAIMGSSGAGKSTFLNTLANRNVKNLDISGQILVNGKNLGTDIVNVSEYVQQDDLFYGEFTVREHLLFQANLRDVKNAEQRVQQVIEEMGLQDCSDNKIGQPRSGKSISGGERKRLSFATKILNKPPILFCDEPTSGLDSYLANQVVLSLKKIAASGTTILATIHQPPSATFALFDKLILLAKGECAYTGNRENALEYFENELKQGCPKNFNPADHYLNVLSVDPNRFEESKALVAEACRNFSDSENYFKMNKEIDEVLNSKISNNDENDRDKTTHFERASLLKQLRWLTWRSFIINYRDPLIVSIKVIQTVVFAVVFGLIYLNVPYSGYIGAIQKCDENGNEIGAPNTYTPDIANINGSIFLCINTATFSFVFFVIGSFPVMLPAWREEYYGGLYSMTVAFITENIVELPLIIILQLLFSLITYWMFGLLPDFDKFCLFYLIIELVSQASMSFGYFMSSLSENIQLINAIAPALVVPYMIFGGFFVQADSIPVYLDWVKYISWYYYANIALQSNQWGGLELDCQLCNGTILPYEECGPGLRGFFRWL